MSLKSMAGRDNNVCVCDDIQSQSSCYPPISIMNIDGLVQDCSVSNALTMEILQPCTKPSIVFIENTHPHTKNISIDFQYDA